MDKKRTFPTIQANEYIVGDDLSNDERGLNNTDNEVVVTNRNVYDIPIITTEYSENTQQNKATVRFDNNNNTNTNNNAHRKLSRSKMMKTLDIPEFDTPVGVVKTPTITDNPLEAEEAVECSPKQKRRGLASHSFRVNWQILSSSFNSDALERYLSSREKR